MNSPIMAMNTPTLRNEADKLDAKIVAIQRSKDHHKQRETLSQLQSQLHQMRVELKHRDIQEKRARHGIRAASMFTDAAHSITPSAA